MKLLRKFKLKKTLATTRETSSEIYIPQYFKPKKKICHIIPIFFFFLITELSLLDICVYSRMSLSQMQQNLLLERSWNRDN